MKIRKGDFGYIRKQKKKRTLITLVLFGIVALLFITGIIQTGTRLNTFTVVAAVGCIPASRSAVELIMMLMQKTVAESLYQQVEAKAGDLIRAYELVISAYEKNTPIDSLVVCGYQIAGYSSQQKTDVKFIEKHMRDILKGNGYQADIKIYKELKPYLERVETLAAKKEDVEKEISFTKNEKYPELSRSELVKHTLLAISL